VSDGDNVDLYQFLQSVHLALKTHACRLGLQDKTLCYWRRFGTCKMNEDN